MARKRDFGILWVVLAAAIAYIGMWKHEAVIHWLHRNMGLF